LASLVRLFGSQIVDERTRLPLGKAVIVPFGSRPLLVGLHYPYVRPIFLPEDRVKYGRHRIGFATHPPVDFCRIAPPPPEANGDTTPRVLFAVLVHQTQEQCRELLSLWQNLGYASESLLLVHGGNQADFQKLNVPNAVFVSDSDLRTSQHPVEKQSYAGPMREISRWMQNKPITRICLVEYDHLPLVSDWGSRLEALRDREHADVLFHHLVRVDGTNAPHYLFHLSDPRFKTAWVSLSKREDPHVVLNALATGSFWTREAFDAVASNAPKSEKPESNIQLPTSGIPIYLEMDLPTTAHHFGFRVRDMDDQNRFVHITPHLPAGIESARAKGAWSLHPVKEKLRPKLET